jgi:hypothetical protein
VLRMRRILMIATTVLTLAGGLGAQEWEVGASGGYSFYENAKSTRGSLTGKAGFGAGPVFGGVLGNDLFRLVGGEFRYTFVKNELRVSSGGSKAATSGQSHALHYDVLIHATPKEAPIRPFLAVGAGVKVYRGTGHELPYQPLSELVVLTRATQAVPLITVGGGIKIPVSRRAQFRVDCRDYISTSPDELLAAPPSSRIGGWLHNFVVQLGVSTTF